MKLRVERQATGWVVLDPLGTVIWEGSTWRRAFDSACVVASVYGGAT